MYLFLTQPQTLCQSSTQRKTEWDSVHFEASVFLWFPSIFLKKSLQKSSDILQYGFLSSMVVHSCYPRICIHHDSGNSLWLCWISCIMCSLFFDLFSHFRATGPPFTSRERVTKVIFWIFVEWNARSSDDKGELHVLHCLNIF